MQNKPTNAPAPEITNDMMEWFFNNLMANHGEKIYQGFEERMARKEEERERARLEEAMKEQDAIRQKWLEEHYGNLKQAFESDPEYKDLITQRKLKENEFEVLADGLLNYKDKAPAMLKHILRDEKTLDNLKNAENEREANYMLSNIFSDVNRDLSQQQNPQQAQQSAQQGVPEKPIKLPNPQMMPELPSTMSIDDKIAAAVKRM